MESFEATDQALFRANLSAMALHESVVSSAGLPIDLRFLAVNPAYVALVGRSADQLLGRTLTQVYPEVAGRWIERLQPLLREGVPLEFEIPVPFLNDRWVQLSAFQYRPGGYAVSCFETTERHRLTENYRSFFAIPNAVKMVIDPPTGRILEVNNLAEVFYGWTRTELLSMRIFDLNTSPEPEVRRLMAGFDSGALTRVKVRHRTRDGTVRDMDLASGPGLWAGRPALFSILQDVTDALRLQQQLVEGERLQAVGRLSASLAHEFGNLLGVLFAQVQLMELEMPPGDQRDKVVDRVHGLVGRANGLIEGVKSLSRTEGLERTPVRLHALLSQLVDLEATLCRERGVEVTLAPWDDDRADVNVSLVQQVLLNLFQNSFHALEGRTGGRIRVEGSSDLHRVAIDFCDNGPGVAPEVAERLFQPFVTTKTGTERRGTGLGLSFSRTVLRSHGGDLEFLGGPGARFRLVIPRT